MSYHDTTRIRPRRNITMTTEGWEAAVRMAADRRMSVSSFLEQLVMAEEEREKLAKSFRGKR